MPHTDAPDSKSSPPCPSPRSVKEFQMRSQNSKGGALTDGVCNDAFQPWVLFLGISDERRDVLLDVAALGEEVGGHHHPVASRGS